MKTDLTEILIRAIQQFADEEMNENGESFPVHERLNDLGLSDETLSEIGLDWLVPEPDEPDEPLEEFHIVYTETWRNIFEIPAHNREEAKERFEKMLDNAEIGTLERLEMIDSDYFLVD